MLWPYKTSINGLRSQTVCQDSGTLDYSSFEKKRFSDFSLDQTASDRNWWWNGPTESPGQSQLDGGNRNSLRQVGCSTAAFGHYSLPCDRSSPPLCAHIERASGGHDTVEDPHPEHATALTASKPISEFIGHSPHFLLTNS